MTIDERLDRLTARHEALTETVEILVHRQTEFFNRQEAINDKNQIVMAELMDSVSSLARIAQSHERRISNIEEGRA
jgi:hypothetical protein